MAKLTADKLFKIAPPRAETLMDKTTRAVRAILDEQTEKREVKTERLRKARLAREASTKAEAPKGKPAGGRKKPGPKAVR